MSVLRCHANTIKCNVTAGNKESTVIALHYSQAVKYVFIHLTGVMPWFTNNWLLLAYLHVNMASDFRFMDTIQKGLLLCYPLFFRVIFRKNVVILRLNVIVTRNICLNLTKYTITSVYQQ